MTLSPMLNIWNIQIRKRSHFAWLYLVNPVVKNQDHTEKDSLLGKQTPASRPPGEYLTANTKAS